MYSKLEQHLRSSTFVRRCFYILRFGKIQSKKNRVFYLKKIIEKTGVDLVIDVGANVGQFISDLAIAGYSNKVLAIEPLPAASEFLIDKKFKKLDVQVVAKGLSSNFSKSGILNVGSNIGMSSSLLEPTVNHFYLDKKTSFEEKIYIETLSVLDLIEMFPEIKSSKILLKLDVQGYERDILDMIIASNLNISACIVETSIVPLYEDGGDFYSTSALLSKLNQRVIFNKMNGYLTEASGWSYCDLYTIDAGYFVEKL